eukprot:maker-scaffold_27-snap-gene-3.2-mRNA-1 protein AED:0.20 eAED:0.23 QI:0/0/0/1/1/1/2/0/1403
MVLYEVWCSKCNQPHDPHLEDNTFVKGGVTAGANVWILAQNEGLAYLGAKRSRRFKTKRRKQIVTQTRIGDKWVRAKVVKRWGNYVKVKPLTGVSPLRVLNLDDPNAICLPANDTIEANMTNLHFTHEAAILENIRERAKNQKPYTFVGDVLVSLNPLHQVKDPKVDDMNNPHPNTVADRAFKKMCFAFSQAERLRPQENRVSENISTSRSSFEKEVSDFSRSYELVNQSIIISGESGAGKTEASKRVILKLIQHAEEATYGFQDEFDEDEFNVVELHKRLVGGDTILESFGNATTSKNANSSRFGKMLKLFYTQSEDVSDGMRLAGATFTTYLLENSRVCLRQLGEKNFRIFYQLLTYPNKAVHDHLGITTAGYKFNYLGARHFSKADADRIGFMELFTALSMANLGVKTIKIFQVVSAILHLGNLEFFEEDCIGIKGHNKVRDLDSRISKIRQSIKMNKAVPSRRKTTESLSSFANDVSSVPNSDLTHLSSGQRSSFAYIGRATKANGGYDALSITARLLRISTKALEELLLYKVLFIGGKRFMSPLTVEAASRRRDALAKDLYSLLFEFIVRRLNSGLKAKDFSTPSKGKSTGSAKPDIDTSFIAVLDIFGFETFTVNGFEQLLINYANEVLLSLFTKDILIGESEVYRDEGLVLQQKELETIETTKRKYELCLKLFEASNGILNILSTQEREIDSSDAKLLRNIQSNCSQFLKEGNICYIPPHPAQEKDSFIIKHYSADVIYTVDSFVEKNSFALPIDVEQLFARSRHEIVSRFPTYRGKPVPPRRGKGLTLKRWKPQTVSSIFTKQMMELKSTLRRTSCSYIRCIKPNPTNFYDENEFVSYETSRNMNRILGNLEGLKLDHKARLQVTTFAARRNLDNSLKGKNKKLTTFGSKRGAVGNVQKYFDEHYVVGQLRTLGINDAVSILRSGLPARIPYKLLLGSYIKLLPLKSFDTCFTHKPMLFRIKLYTSALFFVHDIKPAYYRLGQSRVFLEHDQMDKVQKILSEGSSLKKDNSKTAIRKKKKLRKKLIYYFQVKKNRLIRVRLYAASIFINSLYRVRAVRLLQRAVRNFIKRLQLEEEMQKYDAAIFIQKHWRGYAARLQFEELQIQNAAAAAAALIEDSEEYIAFQSSFNVSDDNPLDFSQHGLIRGEANTGSSVIGFGNNAMRSTIMSYYNRRGNAFNDRAQSRLSRYSESQSMKFRSFQKSTLSKGDSLFNVAVLEKAEDSDWENVDFALSGLPNNLDEELESESDLSLGDLIRHDMENDATKMATLSRRLREERKSSTASDNGIRFRSSSTLSFESVENSHIKFNNSFPEQQHRTSREGMKTVTLRNRVLQPKTKSKLLHRDEKENHHADFSFSRRAGKKNTKPTIGGVTRLAALFGQTIKRKESNQSEYSEF